jgi:DNA-binding XRE family transcriptional regulator
LAGDSPRSAPALESLWKTLEPDWKRCEAPRYADFQSMSLPLRTLKDIERRKDDLREELDSAILHLWGQLAKVPDSLKLLSAGPRLRELFGAYAYEALDIEAKEWAGLDLPSAQFEARLVEIGNALVRSLLPPQFRLTIGYSLAALEYDSEYRSHIIGVVQSRIEYWRKGARSVKQITREYCEAKGITIAQLAHQCSVDQSVIYGLERGELKCSVQTVNSIAAVLGCDAADLLPPEKAHT